MPGISKYSKGLEGRKFNRTTVVSFSHRVRESNGFRYYWNCLCECGNSHVADARSMFRGMVQSCGCFGHQQLTRRTKHGHAARGKTTREFNSWKKMKQRCTNPRNEYAYRYNQRGIKFCQGFSDFVHFLTIMGRRPPNTSLDRKDNDGNYSCGACSECQVNNWPLNCRWATPSQQSDNTARSVRLTLNGRTQTMLEWSRELCIARYTLRKRVRMGWADERILSTPSRQ